MPQATLTVTVPKGVWIGDISRAHPDAGFRVLAALAGEKAGTGLAEVTASDLEAVLSDMRAADSLADLDVLRRRENRVLVQFETTMPLLLLPMQGSGVPLEMPFTLRNGEAEWDVTAPQKRLSELGSQLEEFGIPFTVERVRQDVGADQPLTDVQRRLLGRAVEHGYYDTPRTCTLTELANEVGLAKSTCSETLHRAEEKVVKRFVEERDDPSAGGQRA